jgi:hypothetical protein
MIMDNVYTLPKLGMGKKIAEILSADIRKLKSTKSASNLKKIVHDLDR